MCSPSYERKTYIIYATHLYARQYEVSVHLPTYVHNPESARNISWTPLKNGNGRLRNLALDTQDSAKKKKMVAYSKTKGPNTGSTRDLDDD